MSPLGLLPDGLSTETVRQLSVSVSLVSSVHMMGLLFFLSERRRTPGESKKRTEDEGLVSLQVSPQVMSSLSL